jgi:tetratricopeptide (TPR) repeat protein
MKKIAILFTIFIFQLESNACLNYYVLDERGYRHLHDDYPPSNIFLAPKYDIEKLKAFEKQITTIPIAEKFKYISDYSATLLTLGRIKEAIPILEKLIIERPEEYEINANIAVAYELDGRIDEAIKYLKKAIEIKPTAHRESEWFHLRILESAIEIRDKKLQIENYNILKLQFDTSNQIAKQISYQLKERLPLTKSPNSLLSKVIEESSDFYNKNLSLEWAIELYAIAIGYTNDSATENRLWQKILASRTRLIELKEQGKESSVSEYLTTSRWKKKLEKRIKKWKNYSPYYYEKEILTVFN